MPLYLGRNKIAGGSAAITIDNVLNSTSENPVQNKVIKAAIDSMDAATKQYVDNTKDIFVAEYGVTTWEELQSAYNAGKTLLCKDGQLVLTLGAFSSAGVAFFTGGDQEYRRYAMFNSALGMWLRDNDKYVYTDSDNVLIDTLVAKRNANYTTAQVRNIILIEDGADLPAGNSGDICFPYFVQ